MLDKNTINRIELNALLNTSFILNEDIGFMHCPSLNQMDGGFLTYSYYTTTFLNKYDTLKGEFYSDITSDENSIKDFKTLIYYYMSNIVLQYSKDENIFYILSSKDSGVFKKLSNKRSDNSEIDKQDLEKITVNFIGKSNVDIIMDAISILNWRGENEKQLKKYDKTVEDHMKKVEEMKAKLKVQINNDEDGMGAVEMISSLCARHPSINLTNVNELNYFQIVEQFHRLQMLDTFGRNANAWSAGSLSEDGIKELTEKHYTKKIKIT